MNDPLIEVKNLSKNFPIEAGLWRTRGLVHAVQNVSFKIERGEILGLVGESGSGKSTIGRMIQGLVQPTSGIIQFEGEHSTTLSSRERGHFVQTIFQDPFSSLNPKRSVGFILKEALHQRNSSSNLEEDLESLLESVGLPRDIGKYYPHQFSGGQRQRIGIARALAMKPKLIIADEPVSALDLSIQAQILNLLLDLNQKFGISYLFISHDLSVVEMVASRALVLQNGKIEEEGKVQEIFQNPVSPYTKNLLSSILTMP